MSQDVASSLAALVRGIRDGRVALVMDADSMVVASAGDESVLAESLAGEYGVILREAQALCEAQGWGPLRTFTVQGAAQRLVFGELPGDLRVGLGGGPESLVGLMRRAVESASAEVGVV